MNTCTALADAQSSGLPPQRLPFRTPFAYTDVTTSTFNSTSTAATSTASSSTATSTTATSTTASSIANYSTHTTASVANASVAHSDSSSASSYDIGPAWFASFLYLARATKQRKYVVWLWFSGVFFCVFETKTAPPLPLFPRMPAGSCLKRRARTRIFPLEPGLQYHT